MARQLRVAWRPPSSATSSADAFVRCLHGFLGSLEAEALVQRTAAIKAGTAVSALDRRKGSQSGGALRQHGRPTSATQLMLASLPTSGECASVRKAGAQERFRGAALTASGQLRPCASMPAVAVADAGPGRDSAPRHK